LSLARSEDRVSLDQYLNPILPPPCARAGAYYAREDA
jgi:hypothetical protein